MAKAGLTEGSAGKACSRMGPRAGSLAAVA
jgi:hypothetical protein